MFWSWFWHRIRSKGRHFSRWRKKLTTRKKKKFSGLKTHKTARHCISVSFTESSTNYVKRLFSRSFARESFVQISTSFSLEFLFSFCLSRSSAISKNSHSNLLCASNIIPTCLLLFLSLAFLILEEFYEQMHIHHILRLVHTANLTHSEKKKRKIGF